MKFEREKKDVRKLEKVIVISRKNVHFYHMKVNSCIFELLYEKCL